MLVCIKDASIVDSSTKNDIVETENCDHKYSLKCDSKKGEMRVLLRGKWVKILNTVIFCGNLGFL